MLFLPPMTVEERFAWRAQNHKPTIFGVTHPARLGQIFDNIAAYPGDPAGEPQRSVVIRRSDLSEYLDSSPPGYVAYLQQQGFPLETFFYYEFCLD